MLACQRKLFNLDSDDVFLAACGRNPVSNVALKAGSDEIGLKNQFPQRVSHFSHSEEVRTLFAQLINGSADQVALAPSTSAAVQLFASGLEDKDLSVAIVAQDEIDSLVLPLQIRVGQFVIVPTSENYAADFLALVQANPGALVLLTPIFWTTGWSVGLQEVLIACAESDSFVILDITQAAGAMEINVSSFPSSLRYALCASDHKHLMGVHGCCCTYFSPNLNLSDFTALDCHSKQLGNSTGDWDLCRGGMGPSGYPISEPAVGARRLDAGLSNPVVWAILAASLKLLLSWDRKAHTARLQHLSNLATSKLALLVDAGVVVDGDCPHIFSIRVVGDDNDEEESFQRTSQLHAALIEKRIFTDVRHSGIRVGVGIWNSEEDMEALVHCIADFVGKK